MVDWVSGTNAEIFRHVCTCEELCDSGAILDSATFIAEEDSFTRDLDWFSTT